VAQPCAGGALEPNTERAARDTAQPVRMRPGTGSDDAGTVAARPLAIAGAIQADAQTDEGVIGVGGQAERLQRLMPGPRVPSRASCCRRAR
jgi:hypothetical protein